MECEKHVLSFKPSSDKPDAWLELQTQEEGKSDIRKMYVKREDLKKIVTQTGVYAFTIEKNGKYWEPTAIKFLRPLGGSGGSAGAAPSSAPTAVARTPGVADVNVIIQNKAITSQVCVKAAAEVMGKAVESGAFKDKDGITDLDSIVATTALLSKKLMAEAKEFFLGASVSKTNEGSGAKPEGA